MNEEPRTRRQLLKAAGAGALSAAAGVGAAGAAPAQPVAASGAARAATARLKLGLPTYMFKFCDLDQTIAMAQRVAVEQICLRSNLLPLNSTAEQIAAAVAKVKQAGLTIYGGGVIYMRNEQQVHRAFEHAQAAGFRLITISVRPDLLPLLEKKVRRHDIKAAIHNHGPEDKAYPTPVAIYEKVKKLDKRIGICHDTGHTLRAGMDPTEATLKTARRLMDIHLKDVDARAAKGHSTELGRGVMDIPRFLRTLQRIHYTGIVGIEYEKNMKDLLPGLAESAGYVRGVLDGMEPSL